MQIFNCMDRSNTPNSYLVLESTINAELLIYGASQVAQWLRICLQMQEMWVRSLDGEDSLEKEMATYSRIFAWKIPWTEKPGGLHSMVLQRVGHDRANEHTHVDIERHCKLTPPSQIIQRSSKAK